MNQSCTLSVGANETDVLLMIAKINFLATAVPQHDNLLQFIAAVPPPDGEIWLYYYGPPSI